MPRPKARPGRPKPSVRRTARPSASTRGMQAKEAGHAPRDQASRRRRRPPGWAGEQAISPTADDWEPAIAADPNSPYVYLLTTRYTPPDRVREQVPAPLHHAQGLERRRRDVGARPLHLHVLGRRLAGRPDHRGRAEHRRRVRGIHERLQRDVHEVDRPRRDVVDSGEDLRQRQLERQADPRDERQRQDVYVSWNGPTSGDPWVAQSHNGGATWTQTKIVDSHPVLLRVRRRRAAQRHGRVLRGEPRLRRTATARSVGQSQINVLRSTNNGASFTSNLVDTVELAPELHGGRVSGGLLPRATRAISGGCEREPRPALRRRDDLQRQRDRLVTPLDRRRGHLVRAAGAVDLRARWRDFPAVESRGTGDVRAWYMQTNGGNFDAWNVWYRSSTDGGATWAAPVKISDVTSGATYKTANGFLEPYGDYGEIGDHEHRQDDRDLGRGQLLHRPRRDLGQPPDVAARIGGAAARSPRPALIPRRRTRRSGAVEPLYNDHLLPEDAALCRRQRGTCSVRPVVLLAYLCETNRRGCRPGRAAQYAIAQVAVSTPGRPHTTHGAPGSSGSSGRNRIVAFVSALTLRLARRRRRTTRRSRSRPVLDRRSRSSS